MLSSKLSLSQVVSIPVTTGDSYTVAIAVQAIRKAARVMDIPLAGATTAVVGATPMWEWAGDDTTVFSY